MGTIFNLIILGFIVWFLYQRFVPAKGIKNINALELKAVLNNKGNKQFIDVRTPNEYRGNHIKDFKNIPLNELGKRAHELSKDKEVVVICQSGMRSSNASKALKKLGFNEVTNVKGGMSSWRE
ncbi:MULTISPECIES: rhodanese-like domain-containing protein [Peribacillus]|uniref:rhodanese-like domain-containing protein n=1 Tax=Peribacillus TaxID=2675229 RepID=UPI001F4D60A3|nr:MULTISPECIES: rhodanese-like domain-containing protein [unclassified Peribacillus]MCK1983518.1 rhodanese-like domain-containing protein [Peribacillus sp. Aquil_B1]MCK2006536.1 rhodanese-like domain-containing protein [Peribacillus sp. Aquil_B8]